MKLRLILWCALLQSLAYILPNHYMPWASFYQDAMTAVAFAPLLLWAVLQKRPLTALPIGMLLLTMVPVLQILTGQIEFAGDGWIAWLYVMGFALAVLAGARFVATSPDRIDRSNGLDQLAPLMMAFTVAALISVGIAIHQWLDLQLLGVFIVDLGVGDRPFANLSQPNQFATLIMLGMAATAFLYEGGRVGAWVAGAAALVLAFGLAMTQSRTPLLALVGVWAAYLGLRRRAVLRLSLSALAALSATFLLTLWNWSWLNHALLLRDAQPMAERMGENLRLTLWRAMIDAIGRAPWAGYGWNQIGLAQQATALDHPATRYFFDSAHNLFLDLALWSGLPIAIIAAVGVLLWFKRQLQTCRDPLSWCLLIALVCAFCHAMVEYPLAYAYFLLPVGFMMGALDGAHPAGGTRAGFVIPKFIPAAVGLAALAMFVSVIIEYHPYEEYWRGIRFEQRQMGNEPVGAAPHTILLTQLRESARFARTEPTTNMDLQQLEWMRQVAGRYGWAEFIYKYAEALALNGQSHAAGVELAKMCKTQQPKTCQKALNEWRALAEKKHVEFRQVALPVVGR